MFTFIRLFPLLAPGSDLSSKELLSVLRWCLHSGGFEFSLCQIGL